MRQRASQSRPSRRFQWRETPFARWYLKRLHLVTTAWIDFQAIERASREKMMRDMPPYEPVAAFETQVQFIREGGLGVWGERAAGEGGG